MKKTNVVSIAVGTAFAAATLSSAVFAGENPFAMQKLDRGYQVADSHAAGKMKDGKCGEGKCGVKMKADKMKDAKCGTDKMKDGKCGEKMKEASCGADKKQDGSCGAGKTDAPKAGAPAENAPKAAE